MWLVAGIILDVLLVVAVDLFYLRKNPRRHIVRKNKRSLYQGYVDETCVFEPAAGSGFLVSEKQAANHDYFGGLVMTIESRRSLPLMLTALLAVYIAAGAVYVTYLNRYWPQQLFINAALLVFGAFLLFIGISALIFNHSWRVYFYRFGVEVDDRRFPAEFAYGDVAQLACYDGKRGAGLLKGGKTWCITLKSGQVITLSETEYKGLAAKIDFWRRHLNLS